MALKDELIGLLKENVSENLVFDASKETVSTEISLLDLILGGGVVVGDMTMLVGKPGSGKSTLAGQLGRCLLNSNENALAIYIDTEQSFGKERLLQLRVPLDKTMVISHDVTLEKVFKVLDQIFALKEKRGLKDVPFLVVWDSVAATGSEKASEVDKMEQMTGYEARYITFMLKSYINKLQSNNIMFVVVNQLRNKIDMGMYSNSADLRWLGNKDIYGGNILKFLAFSLIYMSPTQPDFVSSSESGSSGLVAGFNGSTIRLFTIKNKLKRPYVKVDIVLDYERGFREDWTRLLFLKNRKRLSTGSWWSLKEVDKKFRLKSFEEVYYSDDKFRRVFDEVYEEELDKFSKESVAPKAGDISKIEEKKEVNENKEERSEA